MNLNQELKNNICSVEDLRPYIDMSTEEEKRLEEILDRYPMAITPYYLSLIQWDDPNDPIRKMAIPSVVETEMSGSFDTSGEARNTVISGMQHKYAQTVMILSTNRCAMYCRHCFRKRLVGTSDDEILRNLDKMEQYIRIHKEIKNALVSGGDCLLNSNERLKQILGMLAEIEHLDAIRLATRVPVVFPSRITDDPELIALLKKILEKKQLIMVTQFNHAKELTAQSAAAVHSIQSLGIPVKNQTVLLRGINDTPEALGELLSGLVRYGITPYYVFQCRPVTGVKKQFQVPLAEGYEIVEKAKAMQSGLGKTFHYCMSHVTGKIEIVGPGPEGMLFKYHEAHQPEKLGTLFSKQLEPDQTWLDDEI